MARVVPVQPSFRAAARVWAKIGCLSFGGPAGQIALMHRLLVEERQWLEEREYLTALNFCMLLPGPEAMQLATYAGWKLHGWRGGLVAGTLFVIPGALVVLVLSVFYARFGQLPAVSALFFGIKAAVLAIVLEALLRVARRALTVRREWFIAGAAFVALYVFDVPFPVVIASAAVIGFLYTDGVTPDAAVNGSTVPWRRTASTAGLWLLIWLLPVAGLVMTLGTDHVFSHIAFFFSKLAMLTFGGAYAVLSYMAQEAVESYQWLSAREMIDGLGLAETTPGPLILVTEFVGFVAGYRRAGGLLGGVTAAGVTLWVTFTPCFLWILVGAPYIERLQNSPRLGGALRAITAAVVGVILNLSIWFALHVTFRTVVRADLGWLQPWVPRLETLDVASLVLSVVAATLMLRFSTGIVKTLALCAALGVLYRLVLV